MKFSDREMLGLGGQGRKRVEGGRCFKLYLKD